MREIKGITDASPFLRSSVRNSKSELIHTLKEIKSELHMETDCYILQTTFMLPCDSTISRMNALKELPDF